MYYTLLNLLVIIKQRLSCSVRYGFLCGYLLIIDILGSSLAFAQELSPTSDQNTSCELCKACDTCNVIEGPVAPNKSVFNSSHSFVTGRFDLVAKWFDGFFGNVRSDRESAHSIVRLHFDNTWRESSSHRDELKIRGKVRLPNATNRLNLVFSGESDDSDVDEQRPVLEGEDNQEEISLQLETNRNSKVRIDYRLGVRSGSEIRVRSKARYELPLDERWLLRLSEELFWQDTRGFGSRSQFDLDYVFHDKKLLRWHNRFDFTEYSEGIDWFSNVSLNRIINNEQAIALFLNVDGITRPDYLVQNYGPGILYRVKLGKKWFFAELEPRYTWVREALEDDRKGRASIVLRFEIVFSKKHTYKN